VAYSGKVCYDMDWIKWNYTPLCCIAGSDRMGACAAGMDR